MKHRPWFWFTFALWCLGGFFFGARALIFSTPEVDWAPLARWDPQVNGTPGSGHLDWTGSPFQASQENEEKVLASEGWKDLTGGLNLAPVLLGLEDANLFGSLLKVLVHQKQDRVRIACLYRAPRGPQTYRLTAQVPLAALRPGQALANWKLPLRPPPGSFRPFSVQIDGFQFGSWSMEGGSASTETLRLTCVAQGFTLRSYRSRPGSEWFLIQKGTRRWLGCLSQGTGCLDFFFWNDKGDRI